jgi:hypothetical protein
MVCARVLVGVLGDVCEATVRASPYGIDWMRPRITESKLRGGFLGDEFVGRFNDRAKWITQLAGVFPVGVVNAPESLARLQCRTRFHGVHQKSVQKN